MARTKVRLISKGMKTLLRSRPMADDMETRAERAAKEARSSAPRVTGTYADHIEAWTEMHPTRVVGRYGSTVDYAVMVEAAHRTLGRAIDAARG
jgi:hypothetical protein